MRMPQHRGRLDEVPLKQFLKALSQVHSTEMYMGHTDITATKYRDSATVCSFAGRTFLMAHI